jgi:hypothetical protein
MSVPAISEADRIALNAFFRALGTGGLNHVVIPNVAIGDVLTQAAQPGGDVPDPLVVNGWVPAGGTALITGDLRVGDNSGGLGVFTDNLGGFTESRVGPDSGANINICTADGTAAAVLVPSLIGGFTAMKIHANGALAIEATLTTFNNPVSATSFTAPVLASVPVVPDPSSSNDTYIDWSAGLVQYVSLTENTLMDFSGSEIEGAVLQLVIINPAAWVVTFDSVKWIGGVAPTVTPTGTDVVSFSRVGGVTYGSIVQDLR